MIFLLHLTTLSASEHEHPVRSGASVSSNNDHLVTSETESRPRLPFLPVGAAVGNGMLVTHSGWGAATPRRRGGFNIQTLRERVTASGNATDAAMKERQRLLTEVETTNRQFEERGFKAGEAKMLKQLDALRFETKNQIDVLQAQLDAAEKRFKAESEGSLAEKDLVIRRLEQKLAEANTDNDLIRKLKSENQALQDAAEEKSAQHRQEVRKLEQQVIEIQEDNATIRTLKAELKQLQQSADERAASELKIDETLRTLDSDRADLRTQAERFEAYKVSKEAELEAQASELEALHELLQEQLAKIEADNKETAQRVAISKAQFERGSTLTPTE